MATKSISWNDGSGDYIRLTYSGSGNDTPTVESDANNTANARSKVIVLETTAGSPVVTKNLTVNQAACPFPVGDVRNYSYTGSYQEVELPAGKYKLQCWGAQGGSCYDDYSGGKGGYSEGVITLSSKTTVRVYVGGQGSYNSGGFNGGGSTTGSSSYNSGNTYGRSSMGGGGGATDIRLSDGALLSRMIVAGGGGGGAYCYKEEIITVTEWVNDYSNDIANWSHDGGTGYDWITGLTKGQTYKISLSGHTTDVYFAVEYYDSSVANYHTDWIDNNAIYTLRSDWTYISFKVYTGSASNYYGTFTIDHEESSTQTVTDSNYQYGYAGGGTTGAGYSSTYKGNQNAAGSGGSFGQGANQTTTNYRYCSGAGGGGWYGGGGGLKSDNSMTYVHYSGGGSGFVNTAASAGNRPSGYTGLELDSGTTYDGNTSFPSTGGGTETGHSGNGYARITRLE